MVQIYALIPRNPCALDQNQTATQEAPGLAGLQNPFASSTAPAGADPDVLSSSPTDRRQSAEWDASKVPPSRFQRRKGSIYSTPASRDGHVDRNYAEKYHDKLVEKGWAPSAKK